MWAALVGAAAATAATSTCAADSTCADVDAARSLFLRWVNSTSIPGEYTTAATRLAHSSHPGDLTHTRIFYDGPLGATTSDRPWPHTRPNPVYSSDCRARANARRRGLPPLARREPAAGRRAAAPRLRRCLSTRPPPLAGAARARLVRGLLPQRALDGGVRAAADRVARRAGAKGVRARDQLLAQVPADADVPARAAPRAGARRRERRGAIRTRGRRRRSTS